MGMGCQWTKILLREMFQYDMYGSNKKNWGDMAPAFGQMDYLDVNYATSVLRCQMLTQSGYIS